MRCRSCRAPIAWILTAKGRRMPVDPTYLAVVPSDAGDVVVVSDAGEVVRGDLADARAVGLVVRGRVSHFASCPDAAAHRRGA